MPHKEMCLFKNPDKIVKSQAGGNMLVFTYVLVVIIVYEIEGVNLPKDRKCDYCQGETNK